MKVEVCRDAALWDSYVEASADASNYHRWVWRLVIQDTYGHQGHYLAASEDSKVQGVLPLISIDSRLRGRSLVSIPFFSYGGVLASTSEAREALLTEAVKLGRELGVQHVELRHGTACGPDWHNTTAKVTMLVPLPATAEELWNGLSTGMRNKIRSARKRGLVSRWGGTEMLDVFYRIFAESMRNLGTPVYPRSWFENMCRHNPATVKVLTLWDEGQPVAAGIVSQFRGVAEWPWSATLPEVRRKYAAVFLYWSLLEWAVQNGYHSVDLGRCTPGSGNWEFKRHWGCQEKPLHWYYWLAPGARLPNMHADNPRYRLAVRAWQHLPLSVANWLGPRIVRSIP
jgi:FemAB-related protein (PEP-CTERM system-associated)